jgi:hypothetical protein
MTRDHQFGSPVLAALIADEHEAPAPRVTRAPRRLSAQEQEERRALDVVLPASASFEIGARVRMSLPWATDYGRVGRVVEMSYEDPVIRVHFDGEVSPDPRPYVAFAFEAAVPC